MGPMGGLIASVRRPPPVLIGALIVAIGLVLAGCGGGGGTASVPSVPTGERTEAQRPAATRPATTVTAPATTVTAPATTVTAPAETVTAPGETVTAPAETVTAPARTVTAPATTVTVTTETSEDRAGAAAAAGAAAGAAAANAGSEEPEPATPAATPKPATSDGVRGRPRLGLGAHRRGPRRRARGGDHRDRAAPPASRGAVMRRRR